MTPRRPRVPAETIAIPSPDAPLEEIWSFAATYDAYGHLGQELPASIANRWWGEFLHPDHPLPDGTVVELRAALNFEWYRYRHFGYQPTGLDERYIRSLVARLHAATGGAVDRLDPLSPHERKHRPRWYRVATRASDQATVLIEADPSMPGSCSIPGATRPAQ